VRMWVLEQLRAQRSNKTPWAAIGRLSEVGGPSRPLEPGI